MKHAEALGLRREDSNLCEGLRRRKTGFEAEHLTDDELDRFVVVPLLCRNLLTKQLGLE